MMANGVYDDGRMLAVGRVASRHQRDLELRAAAGTNGVDLGQCAVFVLGALNNGGRAADPSYRRLDVPVAEFGSQLGLIPSLEGACRVVMMPRQASAEPPFLVLDARLAGALDSALFHEDMRGKQHQPLGLLHRVGGCVQDGNRRPIAMTYQQRPTHSQCLYQLR